MTADQDLEWWLELAPTLPWKTAETMPDVPHAYVVRGKTLDEESFVRAVRTIRTLGQPGKYHSRTHVYLTDPISDLKWWTMGAPLDETIIINQAPAGLVYGRQDAPSTASPHRSVYDEIATTYDQRYRSPECLAENAMIRSLVLSKFGQTAPTVLDVGCGTGLVLDLGITSSALYTGVDPSQAMLNELVRKHQGVKHLLPGTFAEAAGQLRPGGYDAVLSLFGSPSYLSPEDVKHLPQFASRFVLLMHYDGDYMPEYDRAAGVDPALHRASRWAANTLLQVYPGYHFVLNNFFCVVLDLDGA